ncbi:protein of unknown function DUF938 [Anaeromyxobacter sp. K]|uniref:DUF938 domain-containing protein n=1 Tax=Anaeromyxobacter sp. (strain K) TaxID=447217 RepID=UPI00015F92D5|nr:DUF938 domain-containing protein [Anaeromyxobacter sp. K]ACG75407.1 protein of unknown function DUF938 [Anaeromyxobacter sp. K]
MKRTAKLALRNREALAAALDEFLPETGTVLELGSGTGEHAVFLAARFPGLTWQPSDPDAEARASIRAWAAEAGLANLRPPLDLDLVAPAWRRRRADALLCVNVLHVTPPACAAALCQGAAEVLPAGGALCVYGPFFHRGAALAGRLARFDAELRAHDPALGVREVEALAGEAAHAGLRLEAELELPSVEGDRLLVFRRAV